MAINLDEIVAKIAIAATAVTVMIIAVTVAALIVGLIAATVALGNDAGHAERKIRCVGCRRVAESHHER